MSDAATDTSTEIWASPLNDLITRLWAKDLREHGDSRHRWAIDWKHEHCGDLGSGGPHYAYARLRLGMLGEATVIISDGMMSLDEGGGEIELGHVSDELQEWLDEDAELDRREKYVARYGDPREPRPQ